MSRYQYILILAPISGHFFIGPDIWYDQISGISGYRDIPDIWSYPLLGYTRYRVLNSIHDIGYSTRIYGYRVGYHRSQTTLRTVQIRIAHFSQELFKSILLLKSQFNWAKVKESKDLVSICPPKRRKIKQSSFYFGNVFNWWSRPIE